MESDRSALLLYGAGGHGVAVVNVLLDDLPALLAGVIDEHAPQLPSHVLGVPLLGGYEVLPDLLRQGVQRVHVAIGDNHERQERVAQLTAMGFVLTSVISSRSYIGYATNVGDGSFVHAFAQVGAECQIGRGCIIQGHTTVAHGSVLGDYVQMASGVNVAGNCQLDNGVFLGLGAAVLPRVRIGRNAVIGANAVVREDVPDNAVVVGNPGRVIKIKPH